MEAKRKRSAGCLCARTRDENEPTYKLVEQDLGDDFVTTFTEVLRSEVSSAQVDGDNHILWLVPDALVE